MEKIMLNETSQKALSFARKDFSCYYLYLASRLFHAYRKVPVVHDEFRRRICELV